MIPKQKYTVRSMGIRSYAALGLLGWGVGVSSAGSLARAQEPQVPIKAPAQMTQIESNRVLASHLARSAVLDLGLRQAPSPDDYQLAAILLSLASGLDESNADLARSVVEAAWLAGDQELMLLGTRRVIKADPKDTVAQLRLVSSMINNEQTVEGRLRLYDRFLGDAGASIDVSVLSRLALDAALLERESGNHRGFVERLYLATKLDMSNKAAASLAAQFYSERSNDPVSLLEYQIKLLFADPLDANVHLTITRILAREGAFEPAKRFLDNALSLYKIESGRAPSMVEEIRIALDWQLNGPQAILDDLNPILEDRRAEAQAKIDAYLEAELPIDGLLRPEEILYEIGVDKLRLLAAYQSGNQEQTRKVLDDIQSTVNGEINAIGSVMGQRSADQTVLIMQLVNAFADFQVMRAVSELESDEIRSDIQKITEVVPALESYFVSVEPMALYAEGKYEEAIELAKQYPPTPMLGLIQGLAYEKIGQIEQAIEVFTSISRLYAAESYGAFAQSRLYDLDMGHLVLSDAGKEMVKIIDTVPGWIDQMNTRPSFFMYLDIEAMNERVDPLEPSMVRIRLKNISTIPLAIGPSQPIDSRFVLLTQLDQGSMGLQGEAVPKVLGLNHRLRLEPLEEIIVQIPGDSYQTQWLRLMQPNASFRQRYRLLQGLHPRTPDAVLARVEVGPDDAMYGIVNSPLGLTAESALVQRLVLEQASYSIEELVATMGSDDETQRRRAVIASAGRLLLPAEGIELSSQEQTDLVNGLIELYTRAKSDERARMLLLLPQRHQVPAMMAFDDHVMSLILSDALIDSRVDTMVFASALLTRTDAVDAPIFEVLSQTNDARLHMIAQIIQARLESFTPTLGTIGPDIESMLPPKDRIGF